MAIIYKIDLNLPDATPNEALDYCLDTISDLIKLNTDRESSKMKKTLKTYLQDLIND